MTAAAMPLPNDGAHHWRVSLPFVLLCVTVSRLIVLATAAYFAKDGDIGRAMCQWDCGWYSGIMARGYQPEANAHPAGDAANWAFFPFFPYMTRWLAALSGVDVLLTALAMNAVAFVGTCAMLYQYFLRIVGRDSAAFAVLLFAFCPLSLYFSAPYTESLFLFSIVAGVLLLQDGRFLMAGLAGAVASATRNSGFLFGFIYLAYAWHAWGGWRGMKALSPLNLRIVLGFLLVPVGLELYALFLHSLMGDALAFSHVQRAWGRVFSNPVTALWSGLAAPGYLVRIRVVMVLIALFGAWKAWRWGKRGEAIFCALSILLPASTGSLDSLQRYVATSLAFVFVLAWIAMRLPRARWVLLGCFALTTPWMVLRWTEGWYALP
ncbi:hypothetical protein ACDA63_15225 [Uliginosibacterium sp. sgz301328]|uniref:hypothetical protein n=1 Tax=Uliginosibacterium sp. sgz301328 TaxID=3243764 RepID=UPI00359DF7FA